MHNDIIHLRGEVKNKVGTKALPQPCYPGAAQPLTGQKEA
jgi:hypothetical protein